MRWYPSKDVIKQSWEKYGLIVIGNIVFFLLLYFISYRPNSDENRAAELLSLAQLQESQKRNEAALVLYEKVNEDYPDTRAAQTASSRLPVVNKKLAPLPKPEPEMVQPRLDLETMLNRKPSVYMAAFLAEHYDDDPKLRPKVGEAMKKYLSVAANHEGISYQTLKKEREFQTEFFQKELFSIKPKCAMAADWYYDDFVIVNSNFFAWRNVHLEMTVTQGDESETHDMRIPYLGPGESVEVLEFRVQKNGGAAVCKGKLSSEEGSVSWNKKM